jgi:ring-1,2-phenylacetyl-CoA epoxidase subunit PaaE
MHLEASAMDSLTAGTPGAARRTTYVLIATGAHLGELPRLLAQQLTAEPQCRAIVFVDNTAGADAGELEELLALKDGNLARLALHFIMEREPEEGELLSGTLDAQRLRSLAGALFEPQEIDAFFLVGAREAAVPFEAELARLGVETRKIRRHEGRDAVAAAAAASATPTAPEEGMTQVEVVRDGRRSTFTMHTGTESILDAAARAGFDLPFSCRAGVCSTCRTKLVRGEVALAQNYALEDWELEQGFILACQAHAKTSELEITYDET